MLKRPWSATRLSDARYDQSIHSEAGGGVSGLGHRTALDGRRRRRGEAGDREITGPPAQHTRSARAGRTCGPPRGYTCDQQLAPRHTAPPGQASCRYTPFSRDFGPVAAITSSPTYSSPGAQSGISPLSRARRTRQGQAGEIRFASAGTGPRHHLAGGEAQFATSASPQAHADG